MPTPDLALGIGSVMYALCKIDGRLQLSEMQTIKELLAREPYGEVALHTFFLRENSAEPPEEAYAFGLRRLKANRSNLDLVTRERYMHVLQTIAAADDVYTPQEDAFMQHFSRELQKI